MRLILAPWDLLVLDVLARLGLYIISEPTPAFVPLLRPLFTPQLLPETLVVILLDWAAPWDWMRQIKTWVLLLRGIFTSLDDECRMTLDDVTRAWMNRRWTFVDGGGGGGGGGAGGAGAAGAAASVIAEVNLPLGPGEFDEPIGLPLCVVCQNVRSPFFLCVLSGTDMAGLMEEGVLKVRCLCGHG